MPRSTGLDVLPASALLRDLLRWQQQQQQRQSGLPAEGELPEAQRTVEASHLVFPCAMRDAIAAVWQCASAGYRYAKPCIEAARFLDALATQSADTAHAEKPQMVAPLADLLGRSSGGSALPAPLDGEKAAKSGSPEYRVALSKRLPKAPAHTEAAASCAVSLGQESDSFGEAAEEEVPLAHPGSEEASPTPCRGSGEEVQRLSKICELQRPQKVVEESFLGSHKGGLTADVSLSTCADEELYGAESFSLFEIPEGGETGGPPPLGPRKEDGVEGPLPSWWTRVGALAASSRLHQHAEGSLRSASHCDGTAAEGEAAEGEAWLAQALSFSGEAQDADAPRTAPSEAAKEGGGRQPASRLRNSLQPRLSAPAALKLLQHFGLQLQQHQRLLQHRLRAAEPDCLAYAVGSNQEGGADPEAEDGLSGSLEGCNTEQLIAPEVLPLFVSAASLEEEERKASDALAAAEAAAAQSAKALQQQQHGRIASVTAPCSESCSLLVRLQPWGLLLPVGAAGDGCSTRTQAPAARAAEAQAAAAASSALFAGEGKC
ncbi:uncharacterized protein LOC34623407 [Cyclospora cayetanensis]|uniref:Uncharacterized protein LOC34623407 n=1 Tax=Cyclospora cayetanensis TaxID=88456 RepID=A0A6P6RVF1_9EIME|nr:uncharacterized protein LOC34623407 [Cyclospora cayetanensis]